MRIYLAGSIRYRELQNYLIKGSACQLFSYYWLEDRDDIYRSFRKVDIGNFKYRVGLKIRRVFKKV